MIIVLCLKCKNQIGQFAPDPACCGEGTINIEERRWHGQRLFVRRGDDRKINGGVAWPYTGDWRREEKNERRANN